MISLHKGKLYPKTWRISYKGQSFFGNLLPAGFFVGYKESRLLVIIISVHGRRHLGIQYKRRTLLVWPKVNYGTSDG